MRNNMYLDAGQTHTGLPFPASREEVLQITDIEPRLKLAEISGKFKNLCIFLLESRGRGISLIRIARVIDGYSTAEDISHTVNTDYANYSRYILHSDDIIKDVNISMTSNGITINGYKIVFNTRTTSSNQKYILDMYALVQQAYNDLYEAMSVEEEDAYTNREKLHTGQILGNTAISQVA